MEEFLLIGGTADGQLVAIKSRNHIVVWSDKLRIYQKYIPATYYYKNRPFNVALFNVTEDKVFTAVAKFARSVNTTLTENKSY